MVTTRNQGKRPAAKPMPTASSATKEPVAAKAVPTTTSNNTKKRKTGNTNASTRPLKKRNGVTAGLAQPSEIETNHSAHGHLDDNAVSLPRFRLVSPGSFFATFPLPHQV